jgi:hypothetical protein
MPRNVRRETEVMVFMRETVPQDEDMSSPARLTNPAARENDAAYGASAHGVVCAQFEGSPASQPIDR